MKSRFASLVRLFVRSTFDLSLPSRRELKTPKGVLKTIGVAFLAIFVVADIGLVLAESGIAQYKALKPLGLQDLMLFNSSTSAFLIVFVFSFLTALSLFSTSAAEAPFLSMPIPPAEHLGAKMVTVYLLECLFGILLFIIPVIIYGIYEAKPFLFWVGGLLNALAIPSMPTAVAYLILIPLMNASKAFRSRNTILYVSGFVGIVFALAFNIFIQSNMNLTPAEAAGAAAAASAPGGLGARVSDSLITKVGKFCAPSFLAWKALTADSWLWSLLATLGNFALGAAVAVPVALFLGKPYVHCLQHFGESTLVREKTGAGSDSGARTNVYRRKSTLWALVGREFNLMNREPVYFLNGPFVVLLLPLIFLVMYFVQRSSLQPAVAALAPTLAGPGGYLIPAAFGAFLSLSTSIADSAVSRDAQSLSWMKSLPISARQYFGAKFLHAEVFSIIGSLIGAPAAGIFLSIGAGDIAVGFALSLAVSVCMNLGGLWLDAAMPRLKWNNPVAALKQNPNVVVGLFAGVGVLVGLGYLCSILQLPRYGYAVAIGGLAVAAGAAMGVAFDHWAVARYRRLEA